MKQIFVVSLLDVVVLSALITQALWTYEHPESSRVLGMGSCENYSVCQGAR